MCKLDFKVGWKKLKEVFSIAGTVKRADIKEDKDGKSRGMGTVTFEQAIEAVQAICILGFGGKKKGSNMDWSLFKAPYSTVLQIVLTCFVATIRSEILYYANQFL